MLEIQLQRQQADTAVTAAMQKAMVPTSSMAGGTSSGLTMNPVQPYQQQPYNNRQPRSQKQGQGQGIQNILTAAANVVGKYGQKRQQEQQRALSVDLERVFQSVDGIQQAQDALKLDPDNKDAQAAIKKDQGIIDALLSDPKKQKQIAKALDISFTDPSSNAGPEHDALKQAAKSYSQQLMDKIPQGMKPNPAAIQQLQLAQAQQKSIDDMIEKIAPSVIRNQGEDDRAVFKAKNDFRLKVMELKQKSQEAQQKAIDDYQRDMDVAGTREDREDARSRYTQSQEWGRYKYGLDYHAGLIALPNVAPQVKIKLLQKDLDQAEKMNTDAIQAAANAQTMQEKIGRGKPEQEIYNQAARNAQDRLKDSANDIKRLKEQIKDLESNMGQSKSSSSSADSNLAPGLNPSEWKKNSYGGYEYLGPTPPARPSQEGGKNGQSANGSNNGSSTKFGPPTTVGPEQDSDYPDDPDKFLGENNTEP